MDRIEIPREHSDTHIVFSYPKRPPSPPNYLHVGLSDTRAADDIRIHYDFERDGWAVEQAKYFTWPNKDGVEDEGWTEVAFCPAWQMEVEAKQ